VLVFAGLLLTTGSLSDRFGRKGALQLGIVLFGLGSAAAAMSQTANQLIVTRAFMGIGGALIMPATLSILTNVFRDPKERGRAIAIWAGFSGLGVAIGPMTGGLAARALLVALGVLGQPPDRSARPRRRRLRRADLARPSADAPRPSGGVAVDRRPREPAVRHHRGPGQGLVAPAGRRRLRRRRRGAVARSCLGAAHIDTDARHERVPQPRFSAASGTITLVFFALFGSLFLMTQYWQLVHGYSPLEAGVRLLPHAATMMIVAPLSARLVERAGTKRVVLIGLGLIVTGLLLLSTIEPDTPYVVVISFFVVMAGGMGMTMAPATESVMGSLPREKAGVGSAINDTTRQVGGALGVAIIGSIVSSVYAGRILDASAAAGLGSAQTALAEDSLSSAQRVAGPSAAALGVRRRRQPARSSTPLGRPADLGGDRPVRRGDGVEVPAGPGGPARAVGPTNRRWPRHGVAHVASAGE
jgi:MFS transporter, DHA2 family, multidrug resistance protein